MIMMRGRDAGSEDIFRNCGNFSMILALAVALAAGDVAVD